MKKLTTQYIYSRIKQLKKWAIPDANQLVAKYHMGQVFEFTPKNVQSSYTNDKGVVIYNRSYEVPGFYCYQDNGSRVLAVAHLDTVLPFQGIKIDNGKLYCTTLDDRLGVFTIMEVLPALGINVDWLFTTNEEIGQSTARKFATNKAYNWIVEFDRRGTGVVCYNYENEEWNSTIEKNFTLHLGTFSDICELEDMGIKGLNVAVAYYGEHTKSCYMNIKEYVDQINRFVDFYNANKDTKYEHDPNEYIGHYGWYGGKSYYDWKDFLNDDYDDYYDNKEKPVYKCIFCGEVINPNQTSFDILVERFHNYCKEHFDMDVWICAGDLDWLLPLEDDTVKGILEEYMLDNGDTPLDLQSDYCDSCGFKFLTTELQPYEDSQLCGSCYRESIRYDESYYYQ